MERKRTAALAAVITTPIRQEAVIDRLKEMKKTTDGRLAQDPQPHPCREEEAVPVEGKLRAAANCEQAKGRPLNLHSIGPGKSPLASTQRHYTIYTDHCVAVEYLWSIDSVFGGAVAALPGLLIVVVEV